MITSDEHKEYLIAPINELHTIPTYPKVKESYLKDSNDKVKYNKCIIPSEIAENCKFIIKEETQYIGETFKKLSGKKHLLNNF